MDTIWELGFLEAWNTTNGRTTQLNILRILPIHSTKDPDMLTYNIDLSYQHKKCFDHI